MRGLLGYRSPPRNWTTFLLPRPCLARNLSQLVNPSPQNVPASSRFQKGAVKVERLWAMERVSTLKKHLVGSMKGGRIPASVEATLDGLPERNYEGGFHIYLDRLQVHQYFWKMGNPRFMCTKFLLEIYDRSWEYDGRNTTVISRVEVYPRVVNFIREDEIVNITFVNPQNWGKRCPIIFSGEQQCKGLKKGGYLKRNLGYLSFRCDHDLDVPDVVVDVSSLDIGDEVLIKDLKMDLELTSTLAPSTVICKVLEKK